MCRQIAAPEAQGPPIQNDFSVWQTDSKLVQEFCARLFSQNSEPLVNKLFKINFIGKKLHGYILGIFETLKPYPRQQKTRLDRARDPNEGCFFVV